MGLSAQGASSPVRFRDHFAARYCSLKSGLRIELDWQIEWGCSSVGRAVALQAIGQEFESPQLHQPWLEAMAKGAELQFGELDLLGV
jgi:hypothetical protein